MIVKFIQYCDVLSRREDEFKKFASRNYMPGINEMGFLKIVGSWHVASGESPYYIMEGVADSVNSINKLIQSDEFNRLNYLMHLLTTNYKTKILVPTGRVESVVPEYKNFRFNHHYDLNYDKYDEYVKFVKEEHIPTMEKLGINMIGGWHVAIGPGPNVVSEGSCTSIKQILDVIGSEEYRELTSKLMTMVTGYASKILVPTGLLP